MIVCLASVLSTDELREIRALIGGGGWIDGRETAGWHARIVKNNRQHVPDESSRKASAAVCAALARHDVFGAAVLPRALRPFLFSRYEAGMDYGCHVDDALMGERRDFRSDVALTVFLNDGEAYRGGELVIDAPGGEQAFKLSAGTAIAYPAGTLHRVEAVTEGVRLVAVGWVQSLVRSAERREILFDLDQARRALFEAQGKTRTFDLVTKSYANLLRQWAET